MERILQKRYRVLRSLGRGGLGAVFLCDDLRLPGKQWALKQMNSPQPGLNSKFRDAFQIEAATLSQLSHPNLPDLVDYFEEGSDLYLVMEYVEGENLAEYVRRRGPLGETDTFRIGLTLLNILEYLHGRNVIFRDLKPENVMISTDGQVKLIDFGLARRFAPERRSDTVPSGSVGYAAPEQWEDAANTDGCSDIYSWGATLLHLLSGKIPSPVFPMSVLSRPSDATDVASSPVSKAGRAILERCLKARPAQRYPTVGELADDVRALLGGTAGIGHGASIAPAVKGRAQTFSMEEASQEADVTARQRRRAGDRVPTRSATLVKVSRAIMSRLGARYGAPGTSSRGATLLLLTATIAWIGALSFAYTWRASPDKPHASPQAHPGVAPYRQRLADPARREQARRLYQQRQWKAAGVLLDQLIRETPEDAELHILKQNIAVFRSGDPYLVIPFIGSAAGSDAFDSYMHLYGLVLGQSTINARGGIRGQKVVVEVYDDESRVARCLQISEQLANTPSILVALGPTSSQRMLAVAPVFNAAHLSLVSPTASSVKVWEAGPYIFTASDTRTRRVEALADYEASRGCRNVGVVAERTNRLSTEMAQTFTGEMRQHGVTCKMLPTFEENQTDFSAQVQAVRDTAPELIFFADYRPSTLADFARQLRAAGLQTPLCSQTIAFSPDLIESGGRAVEGLVLCEYFHPQLDTPAMRPFMAAFRRKFGNLTPPYAVANTFDAFNAAVVALENADTREGVRNFLASTGVTRPAFDGISGRFAFGRRLNARSIWLLEVHNGRYQLLGSPQSLGSQGTGVGARAPR